jgi:tetratricopeptide (TPR) repeat protein
VDIALAPTIASERAALEMTTLSDIGAPLGGRVELMADGSAMIVFWGEGDATDQARAAARCALSLRERMYDVPVALTMGRGTPASLTVGDVIERGVELLRNHRAGGVPVDAVSAGLLGVRFDIEAVDDGFVLCRERPWLQARTLMGKTTPCVGRERELANLRALFEECASEPAARVALAVGPAGIGKSRVRHELLAWLDDRPEPVSLLLAAGDPIREHQPFALLSHAIARTSGIVDGDPPEVRDTKLRARLARVLDDTALAQTRAFLGELVGGNEVVTAPLRSARQNAQLMHAQIDRALHTWIAAECRERPLVIVLEDLHWGDEASIDAVTKLLRELEEQPLFVFALARPEVNERFPELWEEERRETVLLRALTRKACTGLIEHVLGEDTPDELITTIVARAAGNAFFLEELCRASAAGRDELPESVVAVAQARIENLPDKQRTLLRTASIFGETFWRGGLITLGNDATAVDHVVSELVDNELIRRRAYSTVLGQEELCFRHAFLREAAYAMLTDDDRLVGHGMAAVWLEDSGGHEPEVLAYHWEHAGEPERAAEGYYAAARRAADIYQNKEAERLFEKSLSLFPRRGARTAQVRNELVENVLHPLGRMSDARAVLAEAEADLAGEPNPSVLGHTLRLRGVNARGTGELVSSTGHYSRAIELFSELGEAQQLAHCWLALGRSLQLMGQVDDAMRNYERAHDAYRGSGDRRHEGRCLSAMAGIHHDQGDLDRAQAMWHESLKLHIEVGDRRYEGISEGNLGVSLFNAGDLGGSARHLERALDIFREIGARASEGLYLGNLGSTYIEAGRLRDAEPILVEALGIYREVGDPSHEGLFSGELALARRWLGRDLAAAEKLCRDGAAMLADVGDPLSHAKALCLCGHFALARGGDASADLSSARATGQRLEVTPSSELGQRLVRLERAVAAHVAGEHQRLFRGELIEDIPERIRAFLVETGQIGPVSPKS